MIKSFPKTVNEVRDWFCGRRFDSLAIDTETGGLKLGCELKGVSFCDGERACYINLENNLHNKEIIYFLHIVLMDSVKLVIGHNLSFDLRVLRENGINYQWDIYDTMVAAHLLNENQSCGLKELAKRKKLPGYEKAIDFKEAVKDGFSSQKFLDYGIQDSIWTWKLYEITQSLLTKQGLDTLFYEIEMPFQYVLVDMFINGIKIDTKKLQEFDDILTDARVQKERECIESIGLKMIEEKNLFDVVELSSPINLNSSQQVAKVIEEQIGIKLPRTEPTERFPKGQPSTTSEILEPLKNRHPFIMTLLQYRKAEKLLNTFIRPLYEKIDKDGRLRTSFNNCIARTGRLTSSDPNLQNIPKELDETDIVNIREIFVAEKGKTFVRADYDLQEIRQLANVTGDNNLIKALNGNYDIHLYSANGCLNLNIPLEKIVKTHTEYKELKEIKFKKERHIGKNGINFPVIYGSTKYGVARNNNVSEKEAQKWIDGFFKMYPDVKKSLKRCKNELFKYHFVTNYFGRKRRVGKIDNHAIRQAFNFWIQGMCADLLRTVMIQLRECYLKHPEWKAKLVLTVHDSIVTECCKKYAKKVLKYKKEIMENAVDLPVKFLAELDIGKAGW